MKKQLATLAFLAAALCLAAQTVLIPDMKFRRLDTYNGLSSSQVNCVFKDSRGYIWIGTPYGLNRYDGYRLKTFYSSIRDTTTMRDNYTDAIYEAHDGRLWLKQGMNYCVYDPVSERFDRNVTAVLAGMGLDGNVERLYIDGKKNLWVKFYEQGIICYNPQTKRKVQFPLGYQQGEYSPSWGIASMADMDNLVVVATYNGELVALDGEKGKVVWVDQWMRQNGGPENQEYRLVIDRDKNFWCVALENTFIYIRQQDRWYRRLTDYLEQQGLTGLPESLAVWNVLIDQKGWIWAVCDHEGLIVADVKNKQWKQFKNSKHDETSLSDNTPRNLYLDNAGRVWIGTYKNGLNQYVEGLSNLRNIELGDINTVCEDRHGYYWVGTNDQGILVYDPRTGEVLNRITAENSAMASNIVVGSWAASDGSLWFGSYNGGLTHCIPSAANPAQATVVNYRVEQQCGLANNSVWALTEDKWHRIWFSTLGGGLQMIDPKTNTFRTWNTSNSSLPADYLTSVGWNAKGWLMVGSSYYYSLVNPVSGQLVNQTLPEDPAITVNISNSNYVIEDSRGLIWQGSNTGVAVYDPKTKFMELFDITKGLYGSGINAVVEDKLHHVWAVTDHGVSCFMPEQREDGTWIFNIRSFSSRDGLQKATYNQRSTWLTRGGLLLVGGQGGLDVIDPAGLADVKSTEKPVFSGLQIFDQDVAVGQSYRGRVFLDKALDACTKLTVRHNDQFTIQLATNHVDINNHKRFAYRLDGFNDDWVKTSEQNPNITYNSLRAGSYTLYVRIVNDDGTIGDEEATLDIKVIPPLWRRRWAMLLYCLAVLGVTWLWRRRFLKRQQERMELDLRIRETEKRHWMEEMRRQMAAEMHPAGQPAADGKQPLQLHRMPTELIGFVKLQVAQFATPAEKGLRFAFESAAGSLIASIDGSHLAQALTILFDNAVKFSLSDTKVTVRVSRHQQHAAILVANCGQNMPDYGKRHLFEPMGEGNDLGLITVNDIVTAHGGRVYVEDKPGGGVIFTIELPLVDKTVNETVNEAVDETVDEA